MKKILLTLSIFITLIVRANSGGPDAFGYTWKDSNDSTGPTYNWFDISSIGQPVNGLGDDNFVGPIQIGFQFAYYWYSESKVWVGSNGYIEFGPGNIAANFPNIPNPSGVNNYIGGIISDLTFLGSGNTGRAYYYGNQDTFCLEYQNVPYFSPNFPGYTGTNTFEIILSRADSSITVNFQSFTLGASISNYTSGIENNIGTMGLQPLNSQPPQPNYTIKYYYPPNVMQVTDASVEWNHLDGDGAVFYANSSGPHSLMTQIDNSGNVSFGPVTVNDTVETLTNVVLTSGTATTFPLVPTQTQVVTFPNTFSPTTNGTRKFVTRISNVAGDTIRVNDSIVQEVVVVDTTTQNIRLCYTAGHSNPVLGTINWAGGQGGVGVYFEPPTYPAQLVNTTFICTNSPASGIAFFAKIYDDNGPGGSPGTLLDSVAVFGNSIVLNSILTIPCANQNIVINSGGVYVNWDMGNVNVSIAEDLTPPFSRRSYETFQNIWSTFRDYQNSDFFIGLDYKIPPVNNIGFAEYNVLDGVSVFPVPSNNNVNFNFAAATEDAVVITISDIYGNVVESKKYQQANAGSKIEVDLSCYAEGTYLYTIQSGMNTKSGKIVKTE
jgi:hypothetical protein